MTKRLVETAATADSGPAVPASPARR